MLQTWVWLGLLIYFLSYQRYPENLSAGQTYGNNSHILQRNKKWSGEYRWLIQSHIVTEGRGVNKSPGSQSHFLCLHTMQHLLLEMPLVNIWLLKQPGFIPLSVGIQTKTRDRSTSPYRSRREASHSFPLRERHGKSSDAAWFSREWSKRQS